MNRQEWLDSVKPLWRSSGKKKCPICNKTKPMSEWSFNKKGSNAGNPISRCKVCSSLNARKNYLARSSEDREQINLTRRLAVFGLTPETYRVLIAKQGGGCAICGNSTGLEYKGRVRRLSVDHCHKTKKTRGALCSHCNVGLGHFRDSLSTLQKAMDYLRSYGTTWS